MQTIHTAESIKPRVLLVEDDPIQRELVSILIQAECEVTSASDGEAALAAIEAGQPNLIVLDIGLPTIDGLEVCRRIRGSAGKESIPIIFLTGTSDRDTRIKAFDIGADDLLQKPFYSAELLSRIRAKLRWAKHLSPSPPAKLLQRGNLCLDLSRMEIDAGGKTAPLSPLECGLMALFLQNTETVLSRESIMQKVWAGTKVSGRTVDTHVVSIRKAIRASSFRVETIYGAGYMLTAEPRRRGSSSANKKTR